MTHDDPEQTVVSVSARTEQDGTVPFADMVQAVERLPLDQRASEFDALHDVLRDQLEAGGERAQ